MEQTIEAAPVTSTSSPQRRPAPWWPLGVGALLRVAWALYAARSEPVFMRSGDQHSYWALGESVGSGDGYQIAEWVDAPTAYYPVGWPLILGALSAIRNSTPLPDTAVYSTAILQVALSVATIFLVWFIGRRICTERVAMVAAWIVALFPSLIISVATYSVETTFIALTLLTLALAVSHDWTGGPPGTWRLVAIGASLAASMLVRPFSAPILIGLLLAAIAAHLPWRQVLRVVVVPAAVVLISIVPWTIRNYQALDAFVPISTNLGDTLCMDRVAHANGTFRWATHEGCADPTLAEVERSRENTAKAVRFVVENPAKEAHLWGMRLYRMMENDRAALVEVEVLGDGEFLPDWLRRGAGIVADAYFFAVGTLAVVGAALVRRGMWRGPPRVVVFTTAVFLLIIPMLLWGAPRFHVPLIPFMAMMAAVPLATWWPSRTSSTTDSLSERVAQSTS